MEIATTLAFIDLQFSVIPDSQGGYPFYKFVVPIIAIFYSYRLISQYRSNKRLIASTLIWLGFWVAVSAIALAPDLISLNLAHIFGFKNNVTAVIFISMFCIFIFIFYLSAIVEKIEKQMTNLVRKMALENQSLKEELQELKKKEHADTLHS